MPSILLFLTASLWPILVVHSNILLTESDSPKTSSEPNGQTAIAQADFLRRRDCPVPCGFSNQLCCNANEICYTDPSYQAQCSATASPFPASHTTVSVQVTLTTEATVTDTDVQPGSTVFSISTFETTQATTLVSTLEMTASVSQSPTTATLTAVSTYLQKSSMALASISAIPHPTPSEAAASNGTSLTQMDQAHPGWPRWKKIVVGVFAFIGGVVALALLSRLAFACFRWTKRRREDRRNVRDFNEMEVGGGGTFRQVNTARMQDSNTQPLHRSASATHYNPPRPRRVQLSDHGPNDYTIAEEAVDGAWPPSYRSSEVDDDGGVSPIHAHVPAAGRSDYERRSRSAPLSPLERPYNRIPVPRAPARRSHPVLRYPGAPRQATVEEYVEMQ